MKISLYFQTFKFSVQEKQARLLSKTYQHIDDGLHIALGVTTYPDHSVLIHADHHVPRCRPLKNP